MSTTLFRILLIVLLVQSCSLADAAGLQTRVGQTSSELAVLQTVLTKLNYAPGRTDGFYSMLTVKALEAFQKDHGLPVTGRPDTATYDLLISKNSPVTSDAKLTVQTTTPQTTTVATTQTTTTIPNNTTQPANVTPPTIARPPAAVLATTSKSTSKLNKPSDKSTKKVTPLENTNDNVMPDGIQLKGNPEQILKIAAKYQGTPYKFGGVDKRGFDCSGYTQQVFKEIGVTLSRTADQQYLQGVPVYKQELRKGDLVFFSTYEPGPSHVGIYDGKGRFWNASSSRGVMASALDDPYYWNKRYIGARRILK